MTGDIINFSEKGEFVKTELETAGVLNKFLSKIVNNLEILKYSKYESFIDHIEDQTLRVFLKYKNHPSIIAIQNKFKGGDVFISENSKKKRNLKKKFINLTITRLLNILTFPPKLLKATLTYLVTFCK